MLLQVLCMHELLPFAVGVFPFACGTQLQTTFPAWCTIVMVLLVKFGVRQKKRSRVQKRKVKNESVSNSLKHHKTTRKCEPSPLLWC